MQHLNLLLFFKLQNAIGSKVEKYYREFLQCEKMGRKELDRLSNERLNRILKTSAQSVPFYSERVSKSSPCLSDFPILTKDDVREKFVDLMTPDLRGEYEGKKQRKRTYSWVEVRTGGTTGVPTTVIHDAEYRDRGRTSRAYCQYMCGFPFGTPHYRFWGSMTDINQMKASLANRVLSRLAREKLQNAFKMNESDMAKYVNEISSGTITHMIAYVDALNQLTRYCREKGKSSRKLKSVMACAGNVDDDIRSAVADIFGARVYNSYGSRDCANIACECLEGGIHIFSNQVFIEIVDDNNNTVPPGSLGRIIVTLLFNNSFPLIRYEIGDIGSLSEDVCSCGRPFPMFDRIEGRSVEFLTTTSGGYVSPVYIRHLIGVVHNPGTIRRYQFIQESTDKYHLKIEKTDGEDHGKMEKAVKLIERDLKAVLGLDSNIVIDHVDRISESDSGKFLYTLNLAKHR